MTGRVTRSNLAPQEFSSLNIESEAGVSCENGVITISKAENVEFLTSHNEQLDYRAKVLRFEEAYIAYQEVADRIIEGLICNGDVDSLELINCNSHTIFLILNAVFTEKVTKLRSLRVCQVGFAAQLEDQVVELIEKNSKLEILDVQGMEKPRDFQRFADAISRSSNLKVLRLNLSNINREDVIDFLTDIVRARPDSSKSKLKEIELKRVPVTKEELVHLVSYSWGLERLSISGEFIDEQYLGHLLYYLQLPGRNITLELSGEEPVFSNDQVLEALSLRIPYLEGLKLEFVVDPFARLYKAQESGGMILSLPSMRPIEYSPVGVCKLPQGPASRSNNRSRVFLDPTPYAPANRNKKEMLEFSNVNVAENFRTRRRTANKTSLRLNAVQFSSLEAARNFVGSYVGNKVTSIEWLETGNG